jgi:hypothetical protein
MGEREFTKGNHVEWDSHGEKSGGEAVHEPGALRKIRG